MNCEWTEIFYQEMDAEKRMKILKENIGSEKSNADVYREELWIARYGRRSPKKDAFVGYLMELKYLAEGSTLDPGGKKKRQAAKILSELGLAGIDTKETEYQEILLAELKNVFLKFIEVSRGGRGFTSLVFGMGQLSEEGIVKKIAAQISAIAFQAPHMLHMDREFAVLQEAALLAFRQEYPKREHFLKK